MNEKELLKEMLKVCGCEDCKDKSKCNIGVDLTNCYIKKVSINPKDKEEQ